MPIYEYRCQSCENTFEKLVKMNADAPPCPECGHTEVKKLVSASGFILKGSGWYKDHYGLKKPSAGADASSTSTTTSSASKSTSETKSTPAASTSSGSASE